MEAYMELLNKQSNVLPGPERIHISSLSNGKPENFEQPFYRYDDVKTMYDLLRKGLKQSNNGDCLGYRPDEQSGYLWLSYHRVIKRSASFGRGLRHLGINEKEFVGIYSKNRVEWVLAEHGMYAYSIVPVALYDTLGPTACHFIISQAEMSTIVLENEKNLLAILENVPPSLKNIIYVDKISDTTISLAKDSGLQLYEFVEVEKIGEDQKDAYPERPPQPEDIATLSYTSGTTGTPKGVILTHSNFISNAGNALASVRHFVKDIFTQKDVLLSFLPLAHVYERYVEAIALAEGLSIGFYSGNVLNLLDDIKHLQPTILPCVPRVLNRVYDKVMSAANESYVKRFLIQTALNYKGKEVERGISRRDSLWDYLVFRKVQNALGGRVRLVFSGGAPVNAEILKFFRCALGCMVIEGYGQTETAGILTMTLPMETTGGHVGPPSLCTAIKLVDVPEMNYFSENDQGELCAKGPMIFKGYYKNPEETQKALDEDGWLHTGDIATWLPSGAVKIIDRKKNIFKLSQGEYIAPEKIEIIYSRCSLVAQTFVYGDSFKSFLVGIVVPDPETLKKSYPDTDIRALCADPNVKALVLEELNKVGRENGLKSFEQVKNIYLHPDPFTLEQGLLTPTMKSKRPELKTFFETQIKEMYNLP